jgi:branched-chain amino acid transport system permease protein
MSATAGATPLSRPALAFARWRRPALLVLLLALFAAAPFLDVQTPLFARSLARPGTLQLLGICLTFGGIALSYDLLFGFTGLLSFGHALYFAIGVYITDIAVTRWHWGLGPAIGLALVLALVVALLVGSVALRVSGIAFAMVTLAFAQAGSILAHNNPHGLTGGEEGLGLDASRLPDLLVGVVNTRNLYWIALAYLLGTVLLSWWLVNSRPGRVWQAIRENERRVEVMGLRPFGYKLFAFAVGSVLATLGGVVYLLLVGGATPLVTTGDLSLALLIMVVLGGAGTLWGAVAGGVLYEYLDQRLVDLSSSGAIASLPPVIRAPLSEPLFILGALFVILVFFVPGGIAGAVSRVRLPRKAVE